MRILPKLIGILPQILSRLRPNSIIGALPNPDKHLRVGGELFFFLDEASPAKVSRTVSLWTLVIGALFASLNEAIFAILLIFTILFLGNLVRAIGVTQPLLAIVIVEFCHSSHGSLPLGVILAVKFSLTFYGSDNLVFASVWPHQFGPGLLGVGFMV